MIQTKCMNMFLSSKAIMMDSKNFNFFVAEIASSLFDNVIKCCALKGKHSHCLSNTNVQHCQVCLFALVIHFLFKFVYILISNCFSNCICQSSSGFHFIRGNRACELLSHTALDPLSFS